MAVKVPRDGSRALVGTPVLVSEDFWGAVGPNFIEMEASKPTVTTLYKSCSLKWHYDEVM